MPNSILWIGLVVLWVFVLFPILADRHPRIRRTTDAALATRVLHRGGGKRRLRKGPAAGHETDPNWRPRRVPRKYPHSDDAEDRMTTPADEPVTETDEENLPAADDAAASDIADAEPDDAMGDDYEPAAPEVDETDDDEAGEVAAKIDAETDDDGVGAHHPEPVAARIPPARSTVPARVDYDEYDDYDETDSAEPDFVPNRRGRGGFDPEADAIARAARYTFRQRAVLGLLLTAILSGALALVVTPLLWWACGLAVTVLVTYLAYLRKQVRMEEEIRRRRAARLNRGHQGEADPRSRRTRAPRGAMDRDTARALRRRSTLIEPDDEDPAFAHLDPFDPATARALRTRTGGDMRRAAGA
ncbi:membrane protein [Nocardia sputorum]|uniref:divisome protein SepX/GlpR n=1 Tax=Nocardia sputorum TaxID=2984338 RepID=UPI002491FB42|nr:gephyrin-like molybdotransferase receptor GlpR [Nocardia sputorum]BDT95771.1 membrane protein [Nocardia sputorum]